MNNRLITNIAVAAALAAPAAAFADATLYGRAHVSLNYFDVDEFADFGTPSVPQEDVLGNPSGFKGWDVSSNSSRLGVKGSEDVGNGLKMVYQLEMEVHFADNNSDINDGDRGRLRFRDSYVGLAGNWGTFFLGRHDTPYKDSSDKLDQFNDTIADYANILGFSDVRADSVVVYASPNFSGFEFAGALIPAGGSTVEGDGNADADSIASAWSIAANYKNGPFFASLAYENLGEEHFPTARIIDELDPTFSSEDDTKWRIGLGIIDWNGFTFGGLYEDRANVGGFDGEDRSIWQIQAGYKFGNNAIKGAYGQTDLDASDIFEDDEVDFDFDGDIESWVIGFDHKFSKRSKVYALYTQVEDDRGDDDDWGGFSLGIIHKF